MQFSFFKPKMNAPHAKKPMYTIYHKDMAYCVDPDLFRKFSTKFAAIYQTNPESCVADDKVSPSTFEVFVNALQGRKFLPTKDIINSLTDLASDWGANQLLKCMLKIKKENSLPDGKSEDFLGEFISQMQAGGDYSAAIHALACHINQYLSDPRLETIPIDVIFEILSLVGQNDLDEKAFAQFVARLIKKSSASAVPLLLRTNFDAMTESDYRLIFAHTDVHEQNANFFIARTLSTFENSSNSMISQFEKNDRRNLEIVLSSLTDSLSSAYEAEKASEQSDFETLQDRLIAQQQSLNDERQALKDRDKERVDATERTKTSPSNDELAEMARANVHKEADAMHKNVVDKASQQRKNCRAKIREILGETDQKIAESAKDIGEIDPIVEQTLYDIKNRFDSVNRSLEGINQSSVSFEAMLNAKIVKDRIRQDEALRVISKRFDAFEKSETVTIDEVKAAEATLNDIEERVEKLCPIKQGIPQ